jgi:hypothetical protein
MGQFSWLCACCDEQILSEGDTWECFKCEKEFAGKEPVIMLSPNDGDRYEADYEGYGVFGDVDAYSWLARINGLSDLPLFSEEDSDRDKGIDLHFKQRSVDGREIEFPIKIVHARCHAEYEVMSASEDDPDQGWATQPHREGSLELCPDCECGW